MAQRGRAWCFTINNYSNEDIQSITKLDAKYLIAGQEKCPDTGTPHIQGYVYFDNAKTLRAISKLLPRAHFEKARGTPEENQRYCSKDGDLLLETGELPSQGRRSDLDIVRDAIKKGHNMRDVVEIAGSYQSIKAAELYLKFNEPRYNDGPKIVKWFWGDTGAGKTRTAVEEAEQISEYYMTGLNVKWFDGYDGHRCVIFDDFRPDLCPIQTLLRLLDRYPLRVEHKGGSREFLAKNIWITCPEPPENYFFGKDLAQLIRRITEVRKIYTEVSTQK